MIETEAKLDWINSVGQYEQSAFRVWSGDRPRLARVRVAGVALALDCAARQIRACLGRDPDVPR